MFIEMLAESCDLLTENVTVKYDNIAYSIFPYKNRSSGSDPDHDVRLKIIPKSKSRSKGNFVSYRIEPTMHAIDFEKSKGLDNKNISRSEYKNMEDIVGALAQLDYDTIADFKENSKSFGKMQALCNKFSEFDEDKQKELIKQGKEATRIYSSRK